MVYVLNANGAGNIAGFRHAQGVLTPLAGSSRPLSAAGGTGSAQVGFSPDGDVLLVTEKGTNKLSSYRVRDDGRTDAPVVTASAGVTPFGFAFDRRGHALVSEAFGGAVNASAVSSAWGGYLFVLNSGSQSISSFSVAKDGSLANPGSVSGLPAGANGLAAN